LVVLEEEKIAVSGKSSLFSSNCGLFFTVVVVLCVFAERTTSNLNSLFDGFKEYGREQRSIRKGGSWVF
jgi:uncharacterized membrane protein